MSGLRLAAALSVALIAAGVIGIPECVYAQNWVVKETQDFMCLVPNTSWRVLATDGGIDISSQSGEEDVSFATGGWTGAQLPPATLAANTINFMSYASGDLVNASISASGNQTKTTAGTVQRFNFNAVHSWADGTQPVVGYMYVLTSRTSWQVSRLYLPPAKVSADGQLLEYIRTHITVSGRTPIGFPGP
jgi:hypothetical protein